ncbi:MAG TPA: lysylphosphatidylglycerol synthase domain-containing protein [Blastocatellia bacterium]|nr:lysylphosphatidylglycerol synthase domain-containing protein [Blastocatellia bacterium]
MKKSLLKAFQLVSFVAGVALFVHVIRRTGLAELTRYIEMLGWGAVFILALSGVRNLVRAAAWHLSIDPEHRAVGFGTLTNIMLAGEAIKYLTATGPFLGEPAKAAMVRRRVPLVEGFSSVVVENLIYNLSVALFTLAGLPALGFVVDLPAPLVAAGYVSAAVMVFIIAITWVAVRSRWYVLARLIDWLARRNAFLKRAGFSRLKTRVEALETNVYNFYEERRGAFFLIFFLDMVSHLINVVEVYVILTLMNLPATLWAGFVIEAVTKIINLAFFFVPTRAGVYESGNALVLGALGMTAGAGVALAIIRKLRAFVWVAYGLVVIAFSLGPNE